MRFGRLAATPWVVSGSLVAVAIAAHDSPAHGAVLHVGSELVKVLALVGCMLAALAFSPGDYMRRAWLLNGACLVFLLARDATIPPFLHTEPSFATRLALIQGALVTLANASSVAGVWLMARALSAAGLELPGKALHRWSAVTLAVLAALAISGVPFVLDVGALVRGDPVALVAIASDLGDIISLSLLAPVLLTAIGMRGGTLVWVWGFFGAGLVSWLFYDATAPLGSFIAIQPKSLATLREGLRALACSFLFASAMAHRETVTGKATSMRRSRV